MKDGVLYAFDPRRTAMLLIGDHKTGKGRWYQAIHAENAARVREELQRLAMDELRNAKRLRHG